MWLSAALRYRGRTARQRSWCCRSRDAAAQVVCGDERAVVDPVHFVASDQAGQRVGVDPAGGGLRGGHHLVDVEELLQERVHVAAWSRSGARSSFVIHRQGATGGLIW